MTRLPVFVFGTGTNTGGGAAICRTCGRLPHPLVTAITVVHQRPRVIIRVVGRLVRDLCRPLRPRVGVQYEG